MTALAGVPFFPEFTLFGHTVRPILADVGVGVLFVMGVASVSMYAPLLGGMASNYKWGLLGSARSVILRLSFEAVSALALIASLIFIGSLSSFSFNSHLSR